jgi:7-carboxy-7-deazaguanine synthase
VKRHPVSEIFGPTIQGEGSLQGTPAYFIRFGGCEFRCDWCDTPHAVLPYAVRANDRLTSDEIVERLRNLAPGPEWVVLTGGNPVLHNLDNLIDKLHSNLYKTSVETQGAKFRDWVTKVDSICVSPKPPSSGVERKRVESSLDMFMGRFRSIPRSLREWSDMFFKVVVFDSTDYDWAKMLHRQYPNMPMFLSAGNDAGKTVGNPDRVDERTLEQVQRDLLRKARWLTNRTMVDRDMRNVRVQAQTHVLLWGNERGH